MYEFGVHLGNNRMSVTTSDIYETDTYVHSTPRQWSPFLFIYLLEKQKWNPLYFQYFKKRDDDGLSEAPVQIVSKVSS